ncbi:MAG TPA: Ig-like domain-containing protein [Patescibacteria group bacterium]
MPAVWAVSIALPATINAGSTAKAQVTLMDPNGAAITSPVTLSWSSSNASVATVDQNGLVTAVAPGTATITAKAPSGSTGSIAIQVLAAPTQSATSSTSASNKKTSRNHTSETKHTNNKDSKKH